MLLAIKTNKSMARQSLSTLRFVSLASPWFIPIRSPSDAHSKSHKTIGADSVFTKS